MKLLKKKTLTVCEEKRLLREKQAVAATERFSSALNKSKKTNSNEYNIALSTNLKGYNVTGLGIKLDFTREEINFYELVEVVRICLENRGFGIKSQIEKTNDLTHSTIVEIVAYDRF